MTAPSTVTYIRHAMVPHERVVESFTDRCLAELAPDWSRPFIAMVDGKAVLRRYWEITIYAGHAVVFIDALAIPQGGGGGSNPLRILATLAVVALSYGAGSWAGGLFMGTTASSFASAIASGAVLFGGMALVNAVLPPATAATGSITSSQQASTTYDIQAQGNVARLEQAIPEQFGRHICWPDFAAQPYTEAHGNEIFLYQLMCIGRGYYDIEVIRIEDTDLSDFDDVEYEIVQPYGSLTLFPAAVEISDEVNGQDLPTGAYIGPFVAVGEENRSTAIGIDFSAPRGLYYATDSGGLSSVSVSAVIEARQIDDDGVAIGSWTVLRSVTYSGKTATPQRYTEKIYVESGRYEVRVKRTDTEQTGSRYGHDLVWAGMRCYLPETSNYGDVTLLAIKMRASSQLSSLASRKINVISTRKLPIWNGTSWTSPQPTRSIAWAAAYCCRSVGIPTERIDTAKLAQLDAIWTERGETCDGRVDGPKPWGEALQSICMAGRCRWFSQGNIVRFHRDQAQTMPVACFSMMNIVKNSFKINYLVPTSETADAVIVRYFDAGVWKWRTVTCALPGSTNANPTKEELAFVTSRSNAYKHGIYQAATNQRRRKVISFQTEQDGFVPSYGDLILVQHDMPAWGQGGEVVSYSDDGDAYATIETSEPITWEATGTHYLAITGDDGAVHGPWPVTQGGDDYSIVIPLAATGGWAPNTASASERSRYSFGVADTYAQRAIVTGIRPRGMHLVDIECINEDDTVHTAENGLVAPAPVVSQLPSPTAAPRIAGLVVRSIPDDVDTIMLSWQPAAGAEYYLVELSAGDDIWVRVGEPSANNYTTKAIYGSSTVIRVAAVGITRGPWIGITYGGVADYMWIDGDGDEIMWVPGDENEIMWS